MRWQYIVYIFTMIVALFITGYAIQVGYNSFFHDEDNITGQIIWRTVGTYFALYLVVKIAEFIVKTDK